MSGVEVLCFGLGRDVVGVVEVTGLSEQYYGVYEVWKTIGDMEYGYSVGYSRSQLNGA